MNEVTPWLAFGAAILAVVVNFVLNFIDRRVQRKAILLDQRRAALFKALQVIDHVYANEPLNGCPPRHPHSWDLQLARDAMNAILVYCEKPDQTMQAFAKAVGLHNPSIGEPPGLDLASLDRFRIEVSRELETSSPYQGNSEFTWIENLSGGVCDGG